MEAFESIELPLRDIVEELKTLNKRMEVISEILILKVHLDDSNMDASACIAKSRDFARDYLADRIK